MDCDYLVGIPAKTQSRKEKIDRRSQTKWSLARLKRILSSVLLCVFAGTQNKAVQDSTHPARL
jgi:hypothetical protein